MEMNNSFYMALFGVRGPYRALSKCQNKQSRRGKFNIVLQERYFCLISFSNFFLNYRKYFYFLALAFYFLYFFF